MRPRPGPSRHAPGHQEVLDRRLAVLAADLAASDPDLPPALPVPGRHAATRRGRGGVTSVLPGTRVLDRLGGDAGRWALGPSQLLVVALVVAVGIAVTAWWVVRSEPVPVPSGGPISPAAPLVTTASEDPVAPGEPAEEVVVHVAGDVRRPGLVVLPTGARVADAVEAAGGPRRGTDLSGLNLARALVDGEQVLVGAAAAAPGPGALPGTPPGSSSASSPAGAAPLAGALVDLNTADQALLETLPGVGPVTATAIIDWRTAHGGFTAVEELLEVDGIGEATLADLVPLVTV